jgi:CRP/FNR family cyclic AMP-dependent transcriptional regulator
MPMKTPLPDANTTLSKLAERFAGKEGLRRLIELMRRQQLTEGKPDIAERLARVAQIQGYAAGDLVIHQNEVDTDIFFILSGSVTVSPNGRDDTIRKSGSHVGEMSAIDPAARRSSTVRANEPTLLAKVSESDFTKIADAHPSIWRNLAREMSDRLRQRVEKVSQRKQVPRICIASTSESLELAEQLKASLAGDTLDVNIWSDGIFTAGLTNIEALEIELLRADFAILLLSPDDEVTSRGVVSVAPRDNIILELGLFVGALGRRRALMVQPKNTKLKLPTDLLGLVSIRYSGSSVQEAAPSINDIVAELGCR